MKALQNNKGIIAAIIVFILAIFSYNYFFKSKPGEAEAGVAKESVGQDVLELNANLQTVTLDRTLFGTTAYKSLIDFSSELPPPSVGRHNPFGSIGNDSGQIVSPPPSATKTQ